MTKKSESKLSRSQWWSERLAHERPDELSAFHKWLQRDRWEDAGEIVKALLKRFLKSPRDPRVQ